MAIRYKEHLILSVGVSTQTAHQIEHHKPLLDATMGEVGTIERTPFHWLTALPRNAARLLQAGRYFPESYEALTHLSHNKRYHWASENAWYWGLRRAEERFDDHAARFEAAAAQLESMRDLSVLAIWSNAQADLEGLDITPAPDVTARQSDLTVLEAALKATFAEAHLFSISPKSRIDATDPPAREASAYYYADDEAGDWRGDNDVWADMLTQALDKTGFACGVLPDREQRAG